MNQLRPFLVIFICLLSVGVSQAAPQEEIPVGDLFDRFGILVWKFEMPPDLQEGEFISSYWNVQGTFTRLPSALSIRNVPAETEVEIWIRITENHNQIPADGLEYVLHYLNAKGKPVIERDRLQAPPGFLDVFGFAPSGGEISISEGHLLYLTRPDEEGLCTLNLEYRKED